ncbi:MAG: response regulator [Kiritimatiellia bacterium]|nr:response regulator [Kiritimatiellia bacterium]MDP6629925.1 response regulator [Kiritimatiellia bacterium]MDP6810123.1 response regulator [Kiritimatiellia bacterium]MDP7023659.1 response regulator [Kiritimatiellia bacterium]
MRILVIDDDVTMLWSLCSALRRWGSEVDAATGACAGVRMVASKPFDAVLLDYRMPDHDGVWFLRNAIIPPETKVIVMSGYVDPKALSELKRLGVGDVLEKPFSEDELHDRLQKVSVESTWQRQADYKQTGKETKIREDVHVAHADDRNGRSHPYGAAAPHAA